MNDFTNLTTNDIWFHAFFAALSGSARTETLPPEDIARFAANIADQAVKVVLERDEENEDKDKDEDEPPVPKKNAVEMTNEFMMECDDIFMQYDAGLPLRATLSGRIVHLLRSVGIE